MGGGVTLRRLTAPRAAVVAGILFPISGLILLNPSWENMSLESTHP